MAARSFLRENQIKDEHLLTEEEHINWDHTGISGCQPAGGYTGNFDVVTAISGSDYTKATLYFDNGILTTVSGVTQIQGDSYLLL